MSDLKFKVCGNCREFKSVNNFYLNRTGKKGNEYQSRCKNCSAEVLQNWKVRKRNAQRQAKKEIAQKEFKLLKAKYIKE